MTSATDLPRTALATPRLIATDLDGTLLRGDKTVSARTVAALSAAEDAGIEVFFVTGRPARWMSVVAEHTARHGMAIVANGAAVYDLHRDRLLAAYPLDARDAMRVLEILRAAVPGTTFAIERTGASRTSRRMCRTSPTPRRSSRRWRSCWAHRPAISRC